MLAIALVVDAREHPAHLVHKATPAECDSFRRESKIRSGLREQLDTLERHCLGKDAGCKSGSRDERMLCISRQDSARKARVAVWRAIDSLSRRLDPYVLVCSEETLQRVAEIDRLDSLSRDVCPGGPRPDTVLCEDALFHLSKLQLDQDRLFDREWRERR